MECQFLRRQELHSTRCFVLCGGTAHFLASLCADPLWQCKGKEETNALRVEMHLYPSDVVRSSQWETQRQIPCVLLSPLTQPRFLLSTLKHFPAQAAINIWVPEGVCKSLRLLEECEKLQKQQNAFSETL